MDLPIALRRLQTRELMIEIRGGEKSSCELSCIMHIVIQSQGQRYGILLKITEEDEDRMLEKDWCKSKYI
jgi:hypothetical protein